ncbi:hypothetical protein Kisp01_48040 [Kineosporia sp. NBRC 101677]|nr:hypothetical protein Kisp01_48040 [Kineosporia sp. NBRC 101677]
MDESSTTMSWANATVARVSQRPWGAAGAGGADVVWDMGATIYETRQFRNNEVSGLRRSGTPTFRNPAVPERPGTICHGASLSFTGPNATPQR